MGRGLVRGAGDESEVERHASVHSESPEMSREAWPELGNFPIVVRSSSSGRLRCKVPSNFVGPLFWLQLTVHSICGVFKLAVGVCGIEVSLRQDFKLHYRSLILLSGCRPICHSRRFYIRCTIGPSRNDGRRKKIHIHIPRSSGPIVGAQDI